MTRTALITGASAGIGAAFAKSLAQRGVNLILVARREHKLTALAESLRREHQIEVVVLVQDLACPDAVERIKAELEGHSLTVDMLINNAGYGVPGSYIDNTWVTHAKFTQVMISTVAELTYLLLPSMIRNRFGVVINVASIAGMIPATAGHTLYGASKAWMIRFSEALSDELSNQEIRVMALCPGFTYSEFHDVTNTRDSVNKLPKIFWMNAERVAEIAIENIEKNRLPIVVPGVFNKFLVLINKIFPYRLTYFLLQRFSHIARKK